MILVICCPQVVDLWVPESTMHSQCPVPFHQHTLVTLSPPSSLPSRTWSVVLILRKLFYHWATPSSLNISFFRNLLKTISLVKLIHYSNLYALNSVLLQTRDKLALVSLVHCITNRFSNFYLKQQGHLAQGKWSRPAPCYPGKLGHMEAVPKKH